MNDRQPTSDALFDLPDPRPDSVHIHLGFAFENARKGFVDRFRQPGDVPGSLVEGDGFDKDGTTPLYFAHLLNAEPEMAVKVFLLWNLGVLQANFCRRIGITPGSQCQNVLQVPKPN